ncbi:MAG TPA: hypothetical protein PKA27_10575 [Fimbriimonadaceae bacterium]|nr:hypothetical protein [Fimbriimonadaceae bacterium]
MGDGAFFGLALAGVALATLWLAVYTVLLFRFGRWIASRVRLKRRHSHVYFFIAFVAAVPASVALLVMAEPIVQLLVAFAIWALHAQPIGAGYWSGCELGRQQDHRRFRLRTEAWLREWEAPPSWLSTDEDEKP